ncbi:PREDICTED: uncharacterized protein LOC106791325 isoform X1 [Polistes canadensis]|uniref:uncharacterized protein LOC106791325 isoform X1 n=2 Tax=Polistes canadensis TaxID=91411 RepID=UPI000718EBF9|nr:PREDICTED: uncharacterized protein LOC106791325 isoform X1 [Polistes canadensis]XP_014612369.1 PREDICTED: uncharacterized protein LOC106791325 isoform X1 [Polistes canadensis]
MDSVYYLMCNFISIFITILLIFVTCVVVFQKLKLRWPIKVNCWFCNNNTKVRREKIDWWLCPSCEQFNGFSKDGNYMYDIPEQYKAFTNNSIKYCNSKSKTVPFSKNTFCKKCNKHQKVKLIQLSNFEPTNEKKYYEEVKQFKDSLELKYPLCKNCNDIVQNVLAKQKMWLDHYKIMFFKRKPLHHTFIINAKQFEGFFRVISTIFDSVIVYNTELLLLPIGGLVFQLCACWAGAAKRRNSDILLAFLWICIIILTSFKEYKLLKTDLHNDWFSLEYVTQYHAVICFALIIGFMNITPKSNIKVRKDLFKKIETNINNSKTQIFPEIEITNSTQKFVKQVDTDLNETANSSVNLTKYLMTPVSVDIPDPVGTTLSSTTGPELSKLSTSTNNLDIRSTLQFKNNQFDNSELDDSMSTLSIFSSDDNVPNCQIRTPKIFEKKIYSTVSPDLFKKSNNMFGKRNILSPPKLKSVTQTSWVAGGYWQEGMDTPSLSRSSSQSSGFGSVGSNCAPSREPSIHELDQCSIISDASLSYYGQKQNTVKSVKRFCQPIQSYSFIKPKNPTCHQTLKFSQSHLLPQQILTSHFAKNNANYDECYSQQSKICTDEMENSMNTQQIIHSPYKTVSNNTFWLHALLCGSLLLNILAVCTTLLR